MEQDKRVSCPVCSKPVLLQDADLHVDACLREDSLRDKQESGLARPSSSQRGALRQSLLAGLPTRKRGNTDKGILTGLSPAKTRRESSTRQELSQSGTIDFSASNTRTSACNESGFGQLSVMTGSLAVPLADAVRPAAIEHFVGQEAVIGASSLLWPILECGEVPSLIFWGPPGCGKTTLARIVARIAKQKQGSRFVQLSATTSGVSDVKEVVAAAKNDKRVFKRRTILFLDEIHRFNKLQQDTFLPHVEDGTITLLGATTENPSFQLNSALLSRCRVIVLEKLKVTEIEQILRRAMDHLGVQMHSDREDKTRTEIGAASTRLRVDPQAITFLAESCDGDARIALNGLQLAVQAMVSRDGMYVGTEPHNSAEESTNVCVDIRHFLKCNHSLYDRAGDQHYQCISALIKSMRRGDDNASLYWLVRMLEGGEDPLFIARRVVVFASEDVGLADPSALSLAVATFQACHFLGLPECEHNLAHAIVYMARASKSRNTTEALARAKNHLQQHKGPQPSVPLHLCNAPTTLMKNMGYGKPHEEGDLGSCMPEGMEGVDFFRDN